MLGAHLTKTTGKTLIVRAGLGAEVELRDFKIGNDSLLHLLLPEEKRGRGCCIQGLTLARETIEIERWEPPKKGTTVSCTSMEPPRAPISSPDSSPMCRRLWHLMASHGISWQFAKAICQSPGCLSKQHVVTLHPTDRRRRKRIWHMRATRVGA